MNYIKLAHIYDILDSIYFSLHNFSLLILSNYTYSMIQRTPSNRSTTSTTSSLMSLETVLDEDTVDSQTTDTQDETSTPDGNR